MAKKDDFLAKQAVIEAITEEEVRVPGIPVDNYLQEAENLHSWCQDDKEILTANGLDWSIVDDLPERAGALRYAQAEWLKGRRGGELVEQEWQEKAPMAYELRDGLLRAMRYAFRENNHLLGRVSEIAQGNTHADMIQDLTTLAVLGHDNEQLLKDINYDLTLLDTAAELSDSMAELLARVTSYRNDNDGKKLLRDKAYSFLKEAMDTVRDCAQYAFWNKNGRLKGYSSHYLRRVRNARRKSQLEQEGQAEAASETVSEAETNNIPV